MRLSDVKLGESYYHWGSEWIAESIQRTDQAKGIWQTTAICRPAAGGQQNKISARNMIPWAKHQAQQQIRELEIQETRQKVDCLLAVVGSGVAIGDISAYWVTVRFSEAAADRLLKICEAKPLPSNRRPLLAKNDHDYTRRCCLLSQRLRRALGSGYAGQYAGHNLIIEGRDFQAQISFCASDLDKALAKLGSVPPELASSLAELLS